MFTARERARTKKNQCTSINQQNEDWNESPGKPPPFDNETKKDGDSSNNNEKNLKKEKQQEKGTNAVSCTTAHIEKEKHLRVTWGTSNNKT